MGRVLAIENHGGEYLSQIPPWHSMAYFFKLAPIAIGAPANLPDSCPAYFFKCVPMASGTLANLPVPCLAYF